MPRRSCRARVRGARVVIVGEQPGDQEDLAGHPFVGPAGQILDRALADAGIDRRQYFVTNAVKHSGVRQFNVTLAGGVDAIQLDVVDAGVGDKVLVATEGFSAMTSVGRPNSPIDMAVIGFVDHIELIDGVH